MPSKRGLTPKQQRFVAEYMKDLNATQAAIRAGYSKRTAEQQGSRLLRNAQVAAAVATAQGKRSEKLEITAETVLRNLEDSRRLATIDGQHSAAIRAAELQGKHIGMFVERHQHGGDPAADPIRVSLSDIERASRVAGILQQAVKRKEAA